ncbi:GT2 family glycosyltransferase [Streptosporangium becharense]|uniref:GT2 family glycosyltransferase n=1 Tax=Streptosporangium becharense TaxID=1816182 RepID=A0A7W9IFV1_9ACTN|nr:glycosyltransferase family 2 protein [Streptosporangium becharense]MBB2909705.1 GT2 family glycosyltransferase [Streptosporangium becharense]MBB5819339.1 GT2 family glycosyltransferase [Streptosporangium becharense]
MSITDPPHPHHTVTAIVVSHDGSRWLGETLEALLRQTRPADRIVGVDNGSRDGSAALLAGAFGPRAVLSLPRSTGFGEAVAEVLDRLGPDDGQEWIWLLHDDCAPDSHALQTLLRAADQDPKAAVLGPKLRDWLDRRLLLEVGVTVDRTGRRDTGLEAREYDQGQYDGVRDVLSVSTAGMLIRRDVWEEVGGLDPALPLFRDDLDLCWRVRSAGYRVLNVTRAVAWHAEAAARRRRRITVSGDHPRRLDRRNAMFVVMANLPFRPLLLALIRNMVGSLLRTALFLAAKQPAAALDEFLAFGSVFGHPARMLRARRARAAGREQSYGTVRRLLTPPGAGWRRLADRVRSYLAGTGFVESAGRHHAVAARQEDGEELLTDVGVTQRVFTNPGVLLFLALTLVTLAAERSLFGGARLGGGALVPVIGGASDLWDLYREEYHQTGLGSDAWAPPYVAVLAVLAGLLFGKTWLAVSLLLLGCVPLAGLSAYAATRSMIPGRWTRVWLAASYALLPVATGAVAAGRLGTAVVLVLLPLYAALATRVLTGERRRARRAAWCLGLLLAVGTAFVPLVHPLTAVLGALAALAFPRRGAAVSMVVAFTVPVVLLLPWLVQTAADPGRLLLEAGLHQPSLVETGLPARSLLLLSPGGPGMPPLWVTGGLVAACLAASLTRRNRLAVAVGWGVTLFGLLVAILVSRTQVTPVGGGVAAPAWPGVPLAFAATGMLVVAALTADRIAEFRAAGGPRRVAALGVVLVAFSTPLLAAGMWIAEGADGPLRGTVRDVVPALAAANSTGGERTLVLRGTEDGLLYTVLRGRTPIVGEADIPVPDGPRERVRLAAAGLVSGRGGDDARVLAAHGVRFVVLAAPVDPRISGALDSQPALARMSLSRAVGVWRLTQPVTVPAAPPGDPWHGRRLWGQAVLVIVVVALAAPGSRSDGREPVPQERPVPVRKPVTR